MTQMWSEVDFQKLLLTSPNLGHFLKEALAHYDEATPGGQALVDKVFQSSLDQFQAKLKDVPDSADARQARRAVGQAQGKHLSAQKLINDFPRLSQNEDTSVNRAKDVFSHSLQCLFDLLHDATQDHSDRGQIAILGLCYWLSEELIVAQFLARRRYTTLAYGHLRSCLEILDKIELFIKAPELVDLWASGSSKDVWDQLSPPRVREKLGRSNFDPLYKDFSEQGAHATSRALEHRLRDKRRSPDEDLEIGIGIGGVSDVPRQVSILGYCILITVQAVSKAASAFENRLNAEDLCRLKTSLSKECDGFYGPLRDAETSIEGDSSSLQKVIALWQKMRDEGQL